MLALVQPGPSIAKRFVMKMTCEQSQVSVNAQSEIKEYYLAHYELLAHLCLLTCGRIDRCVGAQPPCNGS